MRNYKIDFMDHLGIVIDSGVVSAMDVFDAASKATAVSFAILSPAQREETRRIHVEMK